MDDYDYDDDDDDDNDNDDHDHHRAVRFSFLGFIFVLRMSYGVVLRHGNILTFHIFHNHQYVNL